MFSLFFLSPWPHPYPTFTASSVFFCPLRFCLHHNPFYHRTLPVSTYIVSSMRLSRSPSWASHAPCNPTLVLSPLYLIILHHYFRTIIFSLHPILSLTIAYTRASFFAIFCFTSVEPLFPPRSQALHSTHYSPRIFALSLHRSHRSSSRPISLCILGHVISCSATPAISTCRVMPLTLTIFSIFCDYSSQCPNFLFSTQYLAIPLDSSPHCTILHSGLSYFFLYPLQIFPSCT